MSDLTRFEFYPNNIKREWNGHHFFLSVLFGEGQIETKGGGGGWEDVKRPYLPPLTVWKGPSESLSHKIPFILDSYTEQRADDATLGHTPVDQQRWEIEKLAGILVHLNRGQYPEPPTLVLDGKGTIPHDETNEPGKHSWFIETVEWGEWIRNQEGLLLRQEGVLTFKRYEADTSLERVAPPKTEPTLFADGKSTYEDIAKDQLHNARWGTKLAQLQKSPLPSQNARQVPKRGLIRGPSQTLLEKWKSNK